MSGGGLRVLVAGSSGQLARALRDTLPPGYQWLQPPQRLDIRDRDAVLAAVEALRPELIVNAAAYTAVDKAENELDEARRLNRDGPCHLAEAAAMEGARLVQVSTDFVFDGTKGRPYLPDDPVAPLGAYGLSKLEGEQGVLDVLGDRALVLRTAWVYYAGGNNFVRTMLRLLRERPEVRVVADQIGTPTHAGGLAQAIWQLHAAGAGGIHHWTDAGVASWYDFAQAILDIGRQQEPQANWARLLPIRTEDYPTPARRPAYSVLDKTATWAITGVPPHWRERLQLQLANWS
ncbi:MAG TPA: dTDP-4-dehydrorhamnose reductase [Solimonas sp.]|nr:dTDP-4-dehydrorhamnose reductase [Solimonas sp.]